MYSLAKHFEENFNKRLAALNPLDPLRLKARQEAFSYFQTVGFPSARLENWRYTNLQPYPFESVHLATTAQPAHFPTRLQSFLIDPLSSQNFLFLNGCLLQQPPTLYGTRPVEQASSEDSLEALNHAFYYEGAHLILPDNCTVKEPFYIFHLTDPHHTPCMLHPNNLIQIGQNSHATIIEVYLAQGENASFTNTLTDIRLEQDATLTHLFLQCGAPQSLHTTKVKLQQASRSRYQGTAVLKGGSINRAAFALSLNGAHATCDFHALELAAAQQQLDLDLSIEHHHPSCDSKTVTRGISKDRARVSFTGKIKVNKNACQTTACLENKNLLLSPTATVNTRPQLEIYNDEVQCTHGATVGSEDKEALFYLTSRGVSEEAARQLLMNGFMQPVLNHIPASLLSYVEKVLYET